MKVRDFESLLDGLRVLRDEAGRELLDLPRGPLPAADTPAPVRFLPKFDNVLLDRRRVLPEEYRKVVVRKNADVQPTFTVDGLVAGIWSFKAGRVATEPFAPLPRGPAASSRTRPAGSPPGCASVRFVQLGAHVSSSGGIHTAIDRIEAIGGDSVQIFTQSPRMWRPTNHDPANFERFKERRAEAGIGASSATRST